MELNQSKRFLAPVIIFLGVIFSGLFLLKPKISQIFEFQRSFTSQKGKLAQLTTKAAFLEGLDKVELEDKVALALQALPEEKNLIAGITTVRSLVAAAGLELTGIQIDPGEISSSSGQEKGLKKGSLPFLEFQITFAGTLPQLKDFLKKVKTAIPLMRVSKIDITQKENQRVEVACNLDIFFLPLPTTLGLVENPLIPLTSQEEEIYRQLKGMTPFRGEIFVPVQSGKENPFSF